MKIKSFRIQNFRKFGTSDNLIVFANNDNSDSTGGAKIPSTLVVGQNNAGKTSIITALIKACKGGDPFTCNDFNYRYLEEIFSATKSKIKEIKELISSDSDEARALKKDILPYIRFDFSIAAETKEDSKELLNYVAPLVDRALAADGTINFYSCYEIKEVNEYLEKVTAFFEKKERAFSDYLHFLLNNNFFTYNIYSSNGSNVTNEFNISEAIKIDQITYASLHQDSRLSKAFNKIYRYRIDNDPDFKEEIDGLVEDFNDHLQQNDEVMKKISTVANGVFATTVDTNNASMDLKPNFSVDILLKEAVKYVYKDGKFDVPEDQFGAGYTCLMLIIAEMINYVENSVESDFKNKINILLIDEPECYMHPQLQKNFIQNINSAIAYVLNVKNIDVYCQVVITSHSPNILKGKIDVESTFNNVNYVVGKNGYGSIVPLSDQMISDGSDEKDTQPNFEFLKKHIKYNACELFFSEACLVVEGYAEETLLPYYIEKESEINKRYISVLNICGAYSKVYKKLFNTLQIPVAIVTDIDIQANKKDDEGDDEDDDGEEQIVTLDNTHSTNSSLSEFGIEYPTKLYCENGSISISTQDKIGNYYPSSFEEALVLTNPENGIILDTINEVIPNFYKKTIIKEKKSLAEVSHKFQKKIANKKGAFATILLYKIVNEKDPEKIPVLPEYIKRAIFFLATGLKKEDDLND